jgi:hypothetical protein
VNEAHNLIKYDGQENIKQEPERKTNMGSTNQGYNEKIT